MPGAAIPPSGGSGQLKTGGSPDSFANLAQIAADLAPVEELILYCPDGTDPGIAANTVTVYVGPNKTSGFPLAPGSAVPMRNVRLSEVTIDDRGTSGQLVLYIFGGPSPNPVPP